MNDGVRIRARPGPTEVIRRAVEKTLVGKRKVTKYYTTLDPHPMNMTMFDTPAEALAYETRILAAKSSASAPTSAKGPATPAGSAPAKPKATTAPPPKASTPVPSASTTSPPPKASTPVPSASTTSPPPKAIVAVPSASTISPPPKAIVADTAAKTTAPPAKEKAPVPAAAKVVEPPSWEQLWYAKQAEVVNAMSPFVPRFRALDPGCALRIRGSLASGFKGAHKALDSGERPLFNPKDFDIDAYVVSDLLYSEAIAAARTSDAVAKGKLPGSNHAEVNAIIRDLRVALAKVPGNRDSKQTFKFNVIIRSSRNAAYVEGGDADDVYNLGYDYAGFVGVPAPAPAVAKDPK